MSARVDQSSGQDDESGSGRQAQPEKVSERMRLEIYIECDLHKPTEEYKTATETTESKKMCQNLSEDERTGKGFRRLMRDEKQVSKCMVTRRRRK